MTDRGCRPRESVGPIICRSPKFHPPGFLDPLSARRAVIMVVVTIEDDRTTPHEQREHPPRG
jgi:hypothetical protein